MIKILKKQRWNRVIIIYNYYLLKQTPSISLKSAFEDYNFEKVILDQLEFVFKNIKIYEKNIIQYLNKEWKWERQLYFLHLCWQM